MQHIKISNFTFNKNTISPSAELKNSVFVGKNFYKANTLANVSLGYVDHVEKIPHLSHMGKPRFQALFLNDACAIWWKINTSKYRLIIYHFLVFFIQINFLLRRTFPCICTGKKLGYKVVCDILSVSGFWI